MRLMAGMEVRPSQVFAEFIERADFVGIEIQKTADRVRAVYKPRHNNRRDNQCGQYKEQAASHNAPLFRGATRH
jgi:hypothetical protein